MFNQKKYARFLDLPASSRMNVPSTIGGYWQWRMQQSDLAQDKKDFLAKMTTLYQRANQENPMIKFSTFVKNETNKSLKKYS